MRIMTTGFGALVVLTATTAHAQSEAVQVRVLGDYGGVAPLYHQIQLGVDGTDFDYVQDGGQNVVFPIGRVSAELKSGRHQVTLLYQPLELSTQVVLEEQLVVDGLSFAPGSAVDLQYGFPFYRASYAYDVWQQDGLRVALGGSLQLRDATITFTSADGEHRRTRRDLGPVPAFKGLVRYDTPSGWFWMFEADGIVAPVKYLNGGDSDVFGAIVDANLRGGYRLSPRVDAFVNLRWLGGGAEGTSEAENFSDGYTQNWLQFLIFSVGADIAVF